MIALAAAIPNFSGHLPGRNEKIIIKRGIAPLEVAEPAHRVIPLVIFAAGTKRFEFVVRGFAGTREATILAFRHLPLEENGWVRDDTRCRHIRNERQGCVFLIERI